MNLKRKPDVWAQALATINVGSLDEEKRALT
jgi:hypothetical protein